MANNIIDLTGEDMPALDWPAIKYDAEMNFGSQLRKTLDAQGFAVVSNVLSDEQVRKGKDLFYQWYYSQSEVFEKHKKVSTRGIFKHFKIGGTRFTWHTRTIPAVANVYRAAHGLPKNERMMTSLDGACFIPETWETKDCFPKKSFVHTDQKPLYKGHKSIHGYVSYTDNPSDGRTTIFYRRSNKYFDEYYEEFTEIRDANKQFNFVDVGYLLRPGVAKHRTTVHVPRGAMCLWSSKTFHSCQWGQAKHERLVSYVAMLPKKIDTPAMSKKRKAYAMEGRTTGHWTNQIKVNGLQPRTYGNDELLIDYNKEGIESHFKEYEKEAEKLL